MIEILQITDRKEEKRLIDEFDLTEDAPKILCMRDAEEIFGYVAVEIVERELRILKLSVPGYDFSHAPGVDQIFVLDSLIRSAASFGENFGADLIVTAFPDFFDFFAKRGFESKETNAVAPISVIVRYS